MGLSNDSPWRAYKELGAWGNGIVNRKLGIAYPKGETLRD